LSKDTSSVKFWWRSCSSFTSSC